MPRHTLAALPLVLVALAATGCAAGGRVGSGLSVSARGSAPGSFQTAAGMNAGGAVQGAGYGNGVGGIQGQAGGQCACAGSAGGQGGYGGVISGGAPAPAAAPAPLSLPPIFFGIPLTGAQDVVFVLDRSGSMIDNATQAPPSSAFALVATVGLQVTSALQSGAVPTQAFALSPWSAPNLSSFGAALAARPTKMDAAKSELLGTLGSLPDGTRFNIVFFNDGVSALSQQMLVMGPSTRLNAISFVHGISPDGSTAAVPALRSAYASRPYRVVFLSDGLANTGGTRDQLLDDARREMRRGVRFDTVGVGSDQDAPLMQALARESGGMMVQR